MADTVKKIPTNIIDINKNKQHVTLLEFYQALFHGCKGWIEIRYIKKDSRILSKWIGIESQLKEKTFPFEEITQHNKDGYNVYHGACPRDEQIYGRRDLIRQVPALWCDMDFKDMENGQDTADMILFDLPEEMAPSCVLSSGNGYHCYWFLDEVFHLKNPDDTSLIERTVQAIAVMLDGDVKVKDIPRILRSPETYNTKDPDNQKKSYMIKFNPERRFQLSTLTNFFNLDKIKRKDVSETEQKAFSEVKKGSENWVERALQGANEGNRDDTAIKLACHYMVSYNIPEQETKSILQLWARTCNPPFPWEEIPRIINSAKKYKQQNDINSDAPRITAIDTRTTTPKYYIVRLDSGTEFAVDGDILNSWSGIQKAYLNAVNRSMATWMTAQKWHNHMDKHLRDTRYIDAPLDASDDYILFQIVKEFMENQKQATNKTEFREGKVYLKDVDNKERRYFRGSKIAEYLEQTNRKIPQRQVLQILEKFGGGSESLHLPCVGKTEYAWYIDFEKE